MPVSSRMGQLQMVMVRARKELLKSKIWRKKSPNHPRCYLRFHSGGQLRETPSLRHLYHHYPPTTASNCAGLREIETRVEIAKLVILVLKHHPYDRHPCPPPPFISRLKHSLHLIHNHLHCQLRRHLMWRLLYLQQGSVADE